MVCSLTLHKGEEESKPAVSEQAEERFFQSGQRKKPWQFGYSEVVRTEKKYFFLVTILFDITKKRAWTYLATAGGTGKGEIFRT